VLAYAAWSKWRGGSPQISSAPLPQVEPPPGDAERQTQAWDDGSAAVALEPEAIDVALDDLWSVDEVPPDSKEQLVDFSDIELDDDEVSVAPEGLGVRWLTRATEAMSPFNHELSVREEAEAALLDRVTLPSGADDQLTPGRGGRG
jgi:hypothetical protein